MTKRSSGFCGYARATWLDMLASALNAMLLGSSAIVTRSGIGETGSATNPTNVAVFYRNKYCYHICVLNALLGMALEASHGPKPRISL